MPSLISKNTFENLKRQAKLLKRSSGITHSEALDQAAIEHGFSNWSLLAKSVPDKSAIDKPNRIILHCIVWPDPNDGMPPMQQVEIPTIHPPKHYSNMKWMPQQWTLRRRSRNSINESISTIRRALQFMDATGLKTSNAWTSIVRQTQPQGFDHTCVWRNEQNQFILTTEPYDGFTEKIKKLAAWCSAHGWDMDQLQKKIGIWNPCVDTCTKSCMQHTSMFVMAPARNGGDIEKVVRNLGAYF